MAVAKEKVGAAVDLINSKKSKSVCSAQLRFGCQARRLRLLVIELVAVFGMLLSAATAQMPTVGEIENVLDGCENSRYNLGGSGVICETGGLGVKW